MLFCGRGVVLNSVCRYENMIIYLYINIDIIGGSVVHTAAQEYIIRSHVVFVHICYNVMKLWAYLETEESSIFM